MADVLTYSDPTVSILGELTYTDPGWPRPRNDDALPIPWVSPREKLGVMHPGRRAACVYRRVCQVCGEEAPDPFVFIVASGRGRADDPFIVKDDAVMHEPCARLAIARCPLLSRRKAEGSLYAFKGPKSSLIWVTNDDPNAGYDDTAIHRLGIVTDGIEVFDIPNREGAVVA